MLSKIVHKRWVHLNEFQRIDFFLPCYFLIFTIMKIRFLFFSEKMVFDKCVSIRLVIHVINVTGSNYIIEDLSSTYDALKNSA